jgi:hypothetical protein
MNIRYLHGDWFHEKIGDISRDQYIIPVIAIAFLLYTIIQAYLFPIFYSYTSTHYRWSPIKTGIIFGGLLGFLWDGLQGGMIEYATMHMPFEVFVVDSTYHVFEGCLAGGILAVVYKRSVRSSERV